MTRRDEMPMDSQPLPHDTARVEPGTPPPGADVRRLHPTTLVLNLIRSIPAFLFLLVPVWLNRDAGGIFNLVLSVVVGVFAIPLLAARYFRFRYWLTSEELVIASGVFTRQHRSIPVERVQNIQIEQGLLPRALGTAKVRVETAGSSSAEGTLEYVKLDEAQRIRQTIRAFQRQAEAVAPTHTAGSSAIETTEPGEQTQTFGPDAPAFPEVPPAAPRPGEPAPAVAPPAPHAEVLDDEPAERAVWAMPFREVVLAGAFRFSFVFIAVFFSLFQYTDFDPDAVLDWFDRGRFEPYVDAIEASPWISVALFFVMLFTLSWLTGIATTINRYYGFRLTEERAKLHVRYGLLTRTEGTIPLRRVQVLLFRANALMDRFGWARLEAQTMGANPDQQGHRVAVPFGQREALWREVVPAIRPARPPEEWLPVSRLTIRRTFVRGAIGLSLIVGPLAYWASPWFGLGGLLLSPLWLYARARYHGLGYAFDGRYLFVRRGVFQRTVWVMPLDKFQVFYREATLFQRRLGLATVLVDTAGAATLRTPYVLDLPLETADALIERVHAAFGKAPYGTPSIASARPADSLAAELPERPQSPEADHLAGPPPTDDLTEDRSHEHAAPLTRPPSAP